MLQCEECGQSEYCYECDECGKVICDDCADHSDTSWREQRSLCKECAGSVEETYQDGLTHTYERKAEEERIRKERNRKARERYWRPENVEKRKKARIERKRQQAQDLLDSFTSASKIMEDIFPNNR